jgi:hypothetical protein
MAGFCGRAPAAGGACPPADPTSDESLVAPGGDAIFANRVRSPNPDTPKVLLRNGAVRWHLWWTAPKAGTGPVTVYVAAVDGNGGNGTAAVDQDPYGDDTVQANFFLQEAGAAVRNRATPSCAVADAGAWGAWRARGASGPAAPPVPAEASLLALVAGAALVLRWAARRRLARSVG